MKNYVPCKYKNIIFLTNHSEIQEQFESAYEELGQLMHIERLKKLPAAWGNENLELEETEDISVGYSMIDTNAEETGENQYRMTAEESYFMYVFDENVHGADIPFLRICVEELSTSEKDLAFEGVVYFMEEGKSLKEGHRFIYDGGEGEFLIPLTTSAYWSYSDKIQTILVDFVSGSLPGRELSIELEFEQLRSGKEA